MEQPPASTPAFLLDATISGCPSPNAATLCRSAIAMR
jgi:hypothetical protein